MHIVSKTKEFQSPVLGGGEHIVELLSPHENLGNAQNHSIIRLELAPGASSPPLQHFHKNSEETYVIECGSADIVIEGKKYSLSVGDIVLVGAREMHQITATGDMELRALAIMSPGFDPGDIYEAGA